MPLPASAKAAAPSANGSTRGAPKTTTTKVPLSEMLGADASRAAESIAKHANDETRVGFINLPPGIDYGIAQLTQAYFSQYKTGDNAGKTFVRFVGNVHEPHFAVGRDGNKMKVRGLQTSLQIPLFDQTNSKGEIYSDFDRQIDILLNEFRKLGGKDYTKDVQSLDDLEPLAEGLVALAPFFVFSTTPRIAQKDAQGVKKGDVTGAWENWHGAEGLEGYQPEEAQHVGADNTEVVSPPPPSAPAKATPAKPSTGPVKPPVTAPVKKPAAPPPPVVEEHPPFVPEECDDLDMLLLDAESQSDTAPDSQERIRQIGLASGVSDEDQQALPTWDKVVETIKGAIEGAGQVQNDEPQGINVGDVVGYHPKNPVTKKKQKDPVRATVTAVGENDVDLKVGKATYKKVSVDDLVEAPAE